MSATLTDELIRKAKEAAEETEGLRRQMTAASDRRAEALYALAAEGMSMRKIAEVTGVSHSVVQRLLEKARASRPSLKRREEWVSYEMHRAVAEKVLENPQPVLSKARTNLQKMLARTRGAHATGWVREWESLLNGDILDLVGAMLRPDERGIDLRQMTPFAGVLSQAEREVALHKAQKDLSAA
ncbi:helix-turn-helix domain-containing protein [Paenarthrobacter nicotinovorans]|jgi:transposase|uniref:helix-turn-helix domain-containing protein n=1 Tax=Paenarthrobacter nicotinovorans TaxID=29320 RepID=UPI003801ED9C